METESEINNIKPRTRQEREALRNKEAIEKNRIDQRVGYEARNIDVRTLLHHTDPKSDLYCPENVRFDKDFCAYERKRREEENRKKEEVMENRRVAHLQREANKWEKMENEFSHCQNILEQKKKIQSEAGTYSNGHAYNPITLEYHTTQKGDKLKQKDEDAQLRGKLRAKNLDMRANTGYNIVTGENRKGIDVPKDVFQRYAEQFLLPQKLIDMKSHSPFMQASKTQAGGSKISGVGQNNASVVSKTSHAVAGGKKPADKAEGDETDKKNSEMTKMQKKEETSEERFKKVSICEEESKNLIRVFNLFINEEKILAREAKGKKETGKHENKTGNIDDINYFDSKAVRSILGKLGVKEIREHDIEIMIWEVDENLDWRVDWNEFELMYKKCIEDQLGLEPRNLFNLVQFLMFCKPPEDDRGNPKSDLEFRTNIKAEDTYFLIYGRIDRQEEQRRIRNGEKGKGPGSGEILAMLDEEIKLVFLDPDKPEDKVVDPEKEIDYLTYLRRVNKQALIKRQEGKEKRKVQREPKEK